MENNALALLYRLAFARHNLVDFDLATLFYSPSDCYCKQLTLFITEGEHSGLATFLVCIQSVSFGNVFDSDSSPSNMLSAIIQ